jgi:hypothetical protein
MTEHKIDGPTLWARWNAPFYDSVYQERRARERERERQRLERMRKHRSREIWSGVFLVVAMPLALWFLLAARPSHELDQRAPAQCGTALPGEPIWIDLQGRRLDCSGKVIR